MYAQDLIAKRAQSLQTLAEPIPSPCVSICRMDPASGWCEGCLRTIDEIARWSTLDDQQKGEIWQQLAQRAQGVF
ncbi:MAG: DUF1289 domain-containing protein [Rhodoferax sp.]|nr:DUF1289 domain-containing protein [Rhodoferax sp.]